MAQRVDPDLLLELKAYSEEGAFNVETCFNCGNCTAICSLTSDEHPFPRNTIRLMQLGLRDQLLTNIDPWQCYYCGECTETCPKGAEPAEAMMTLRRWLTAQYDKSGHGAKLYTSEKAVLWSIIRAAGLPFVLIVLYHVIFALTGNAPDLGLTDNGLVPLNTFAPVQLIWILVLGHFTFLGYRLLTNALHMYKLFIGKNPLEAGIPIAVYVSEFKDFITHFATQKRWRDCEEGKPNFRWRKHLFLVSGYLTMLMLVVVLLGWFQTDNIYPIWHPQRWLGYYATVALIYTSAEALIGRYRRREEMHKFSHTTDWLFPSFILVGAVTGIFVHLFRYMGLAWPTYIIYVIHFMAMMAMLDTEVGIGKWTHLIYRPLAMYLEAVKKKAAQLEKAAPGLAAAGD